MASHTGGSGGSDRFVGPHLRPPVDSPPAGLQFGSPSASHQKPLNRQQQRQLHLSRLQQTQPPWTSDRLQHSRRRRRHRQLRQQLCRPLKSVCSPLTVPTLPIIYLRPFTTAGVCMGCSSRARSVFEAMDRDGDGQLSRSEFEIDSGWDLERTKYKP